MRMQLIGNPALDLINVRVTYSNEGHSLERDLVTSEIHMFDLDGSPTLLTGSFVAFFLALPFDSGGSTGRFGFSIEATF